MDFYSLMLIKDFSLQQPCMDKLRKLRARKYCAEFRYLIAFDMYNLNLPIICNKDKFYTRF